MSEWISMGDELPPESEHSDLFLVVDVYGDIQTSEFFDDMCGACYFTDMHDRPLNVTHWLRIPERPK